MLTPVRRGHSWLYFTGTTPRGLVAAAWLTPLARANGWNPEVCSLHKASSGQPSLLVGGRWHFASISHAVGLTVIAVHQTCPIGVDVEPIAEGRTDQDLHALYFPEAKPPMVAPQADNDAFLALWTAAEAWLKAHGRGVPDLDEAKNAMIIPGEGSRSWREERCSLGWRVSEVVLDPTHSLCRLRKSGLHRFCDKRLHQLQDPSSIRWRSRECLLMSTQGVPDFPRTTTQLQITRDRRRPRGAWVAS